MKNNEAYTSMAEQIKANDGVDKESKEEIERRTKTKRRTNKSSDNRGNQIDYTMTKNENCIRMGQGNEPNAEGATIKWSERNGSKHI